MTSHKALTLQSHTFASIYKIARQHTLEELNCKLAFAMDQEVQQEDGQREEIPSALPQKTHTKRDRRFDDSLLPSDPHFDRSKVSDKEFIELLLFEIKELRCALSSKSEKTKSPCLPTLQDKNEGATQLIHDQTLTNLDVPQRSARRKLSTKTRDSKDSELLREIRRESTSSVTSNGPIAVSDGIPLSQNFRSELSAALGITASSENSPVTSLSEDMAYAHSSATLCVPSGGKEDHIDDELIEVANPSSTKSGNLAISGDRQDTTPSGEMHLSSGSTLNSYKSRIKLPIAHKLSDSKVFTLNATPDRPNSNTMNFKAEEHGEDSTKNDEVMEAKQPQTPDALAHASRGSFSQSEISGPPSGGSHYYNDSPRTSSPSNFNLTPKTNSYFDLSRTPITNTLASSDSIQSSTRTSSQTPGSSFQVLSTPKTEDEPAELIVKPEEFHTIQINVVSTIAVNPKKMDDPNCTISVCDKETGKEMWRIRKTYSHLSTFDEEIRPVVEFFGLPGLPEKSSFSSTTPLKVDARRAALQNYFNTIFVMPHVPRLVLVRICRFLSLDFVNPLDDFRAGAKKEGFLIRRYKGLGTAWKVRWCQVDGPELEIYDLPGGSLLELIRLYGSQIGRQSSDTVAEERGYRHAFLILENTKSSKLTNSLPKHFFCAETDKERDEWVAAMVEFTENDPLTCQDGRASDVESPIISLDHAKDVGLILAKSAVATPTGNTLTGAEEVLIAAIHHEELTRDQKKPKKKSRFAFRNRVSTHSDGEVGPMESVSMPQVAELPMQAYLDQLKLSEEPARVIFGRDIEEAFKLSHRAFNGREIPSICFRCLDFLIRTGAVYEEGIFRLSGSASSIRQLKDKFNLVHDVDLFESNLRPDMHTVAGLLKTYLRELPTPIFGRTTYSELQNIVSQVGSNPSSSMVMKMKNYLRDSRNIGKVHYDFCVVIFGYLRSVIAKCSLNKMSLRNVCIVFVPTLNISVDILSACLTDYDCIFGDASPIPDLERQVIDVHIPTF